MVITNNVIDQVVVFLEVHEAASGPQLTQIGLQPAAICLSFGGLWS
jgi:hypothetical protein